jgi:hypothetical protein
MKEERSGKGKKKRKNEKIREVGKKGRREKKRNNEKKETTE